MIIKPDHTSLNQKQLNVINLAKVIKRSYDRACAEPLSQDARRLCLAVAALESAEEQERQVRKVARRTIPAAAAATARHVAKGGATLVQEKMAAEPPCDWIMIKYRGRFVSVRRDTLPHLKRKYVVLWDKGAPSQEEALSAYAQQCVDAMWKGVRPAKTTATKTPAKGPATKRSSKVQ